MVDTPRILTDRFLLRPLHPDDASARYSSWLEEAQAARYIVSAGQPHDIPALRVYIEERMGRDDVLFLGIFTRDTGEHLGNIKYEPVDSLNRFAVMGILIGERSWRGKRIAREVIDASAEWLHENRSIDEIILGVDKTHLAAITAYEKAGFGVEKSSRIREDAASALIMVRHFARPGKKKAGA